MALTIPPEMWVRTAEFIPSSILRNLYSVNPVFLHLALNARYRSVNLAVWWTPQTTKYIKHLSHPHIAHRVQRLTLSSNGLKSNICLNSWEKVTFLTTLGWYLPFDLGRFIDPIVRRVSGVKRCDTLIQNAVLNFPNLSALTIFEGSGHTHPGPLLLNTYTACTSTLRTLHLFTESLDFNDIFPTNPPKFMSLEEVSLTFSRALYHSCADTKVASAFFQAIASTLTNLSICCGSSNELLQSFPLGTAFPKLTSFSLRSAPPGSILMQFLNQHGDTLKHLRVEHPNPPLAASQSLLHPVLPNLESLDILNSPSYDRQSRLASREGLHVVRAYIQYSGGTLTSLSLTHCIFTLHDLGILVDLLGRSENAKGGGLTSLTIAVQVLSPQMMDMLAEKLPRLERLKVYFAHLKGRDLLTEDSDLGDLTREDIEPFLFEMEKRSYSSWSLTSLGIDHVWAQPDKSQAMAILVPLALCMPHLVEIDAPFVRMWREPGSTWKPCQSTSDDIWPPCAAVTYVIAKHMSMYCVGAY